MSTNYHTAISTGAAANASTFNSPMGELDAQITINTSEITDARGSQASLDARLDTSLNNAGNLKSGAVSAQSMVNLGDAAATGGDAIRYNEFAQEHSAAGAHAADIIDQAQMALTSLANESGEAVRYDEFSQEHNNDGTHANAVIGNDELKSEVAGDGLTGGAGSALDVVGGNGIAAAADSIAVDLDGGANDGLEFSGGKLTCSAATTSAKGVVELASSGEVASGVVVQGNDARLFRKIIYADNTVGGGNGVAAAALPEFAYDDPADGQEIKIRTTYVHGQDGNGSLVLFCEGQITADPSPNYARVYLQTTYDGVSFESQYATIDDYGTWGKYKIILDVSGLDTDTRYEVRVLLSWSGSPASGETAKIRRCTIMTEA